MSAIHILHKQLSRTWLVITLLCTALFGTGSLAHASNEVMVSVSALYDIMPPDASVYKETPEKFFVVNINNPQDHTLTVYLTLKLEKLTGEQKKRLGALVNITKTLSALLGKTVTEYIEDYAG